MEKEQPLGAKTDPWQTAERKEDTSVQRTKFGQQPEWAWKQILPQGLQQEIYPANLLILAL